MTGPAGVVLGAVVLAASAPAAAVAAVDYGPDLPQGPQDRRRGVDEPEAPAADRPRREPVRPAERGQVGEQPGVVLLRQVPVAVDAAEQVRRLVLEAQGGRQRVQVQRRHRDGRRHPPARERDGERRQGAEAVRDQVEGLQDELGLARWRCRWTRRSSRRGSRATSTPSPGCACSSPAAARRPRATAAVADGGTPTRTGTPAFGCVPASFPAALASEQRPVPEPDPDRLRDRAAAGRRAPGPGRAAGDRRRGADAGRGRQHVPLLLRDAGHVAEDPQRRLDQADPRELARRDGRLDGRAAARRASTSGCTRSARATTTATSRAS